MTLCTIGHLAKPYGVSTSTIRRWEAAGLIAASERTLGGHRRFRIEDDDGNHERKVVGYARVSSYDQKEDLQRQIVRLSNAGCDEVISDIGSGLNCKKPGLKSLLTKRLFGKIARLVVTHEDRLLPSTFSTAKFLHQTRPSLKKAVFPGLGSSVICFWKFSGKSAAASRLTAKVVPFGSIPVVGR